MSTPISAIPDDVDMPDMDDIDDDLFPADTPAYVPVAVQRKSVSKPAKEGYLQKYKDYIILLISTSIALKIPLDSIRKQAPAQLFALGDIPVRALIILVAYVLALKLVKNLLV